MVKDTRKELKMGNANIVFMDRNMLSTLETAIKYLQKLRKDGACIDNRRLRLGFELLNKMRDIVIYSYSNKCGISDGNSHVVESLRVEFYGSNPVIKINTRCGKTLHCLSIDDMRFFQYIEDASSKFLHDIEVLNSRCRSRVFDEKVIKSLCEMLNHHEKSNNVFFDHEKLVGVNIIDSKEDSRIEVITYHNEYHNHYDVTTTGVHLGTMMINSSDDVRAYCYNYIFGSPVVESYSSLNLKNDWQKIKDKFELPIDKKVECLPNQLHPYVRERYGWRAGLGSTKYPKDNYLYPDKHGNSLESLHRHLAKYENGDTSEDHLSAIIFRVQSLMLKEKEKGIKSDHYKNSLV